MLAARAKIVTGMLRAARPHATLLRLRPYATASSAPGSKIPEKTSNAASADVSVAAAGEGDAVLDPPEVVAKRWLSYFPFEDGTRMTRASALTLALGTLMFGISKEIIFIDEDMRRTLAMLLTLGAAVHYKRDLIYSMYDDYISVRFLFFFFSLHWNIRL